jgi:hypothetical protein
MYRRRFLATLIGASFGALVSSNAQAQFGGISGALGGGGGGGGGASAEGIVKSYVNGTKKVMKADSYMLKALGLKELAEKTELAANNLTEGATSSGLEDAAKVQTESSKAIADEMAAKKTITDADSKKTYTQGLLELAKGIKDYTGLSKDVKGYKPSVTSLGAAAGAAAFVVKSLPDNISNLTSTLKRAIDFAKENKIEVPAEATSVL